MEARIAQLRRVLEAKGLDAALLKLPENLVLFSGYWPLNGFSFLFVHRSGGSALVVPEGDREEAARGDVEDVRRFPWGRLADGDPWANAAALLGGLAREYALRDPSRIGVDAGADAFGPCLCCGELQPMGRRSLELAREALGCPDPVEIQPDIVGLRAVKFPGEVERIELADEIAYVGVEAFERAAAPGAREIDVAAEVESAVARAGAGHRGLTRYAKAFTQVSSGPARTAAGWLSGIATTGRAIERGDFVMLEMGVVADGYWADLTRTVVAGTPNARQSEMLEAVASAQAAAIAAERPGVPARELDRAARAAIGARGLGEAFFHNLGHGTGIAYHDGGPFLGPGSGTVLEEGMIHSCEPGVYVEGVGGVRQEANVLVTATGARVLGLGAGPALKV